MPIAKLFPARRGETSIALYPTFDDNAPATALMAPKLFLSIQGTCVDATDQLSLTGPAIQ